MILGDVLRCECRRPVIVMESSPTSSCVIVISGWGFSYWSIDLRMKVMLWMLWRAGDSFRLLALKVCYESNMWRGNSWDGAHWRGGCKSYTAVDFSFGTW